MYCNFKFSTDHLLAKVDFDFCLSIVTMTINKVNIINVKARNFFTISLKIQHQHTYYADDLMNKVAGKRTVTRNII